MFAEPKQADGYEIPPEPPRGAPPPPPYNTRVPSIYATRGTFILCCAHLRTGYVYGRSLARADRQAGRETLIKRHARLPGVVSGSADVSRCADTSWYLARALMRSLISAGVPGFGVTWGFGRSFTTCM